MKTKPRKSINMKGGKAYRVQLSTVNKAPMFLCKKDIFDQEFGPNICLLLDINWCVFNTNQQQYICTHYNRILLLIFLAKTNGIRGRISHTCKVPVREREREKS
jgi:hypothetical protein